MPRKKTSSGQRQFVAGKVKNRFKALLLEKAYKEGSPIALREVARITGVGVSTWSKWYQDQVTYYDGEKIAILCEFFGCTPGDLLEYTPPQREGKKQ
jgi:DNA-binding Xre family transcriptional regulator